MSATFEALWSVLDYLRILHTRAASPTQRAWLAGILDRCDGEVLHECYRLISESIDVDMTKAMKQTCIREGYSEVSVELVDALSLSLSLFPLTVQLTGTRWPESQVGRRRKSVGTYSNKTLSLSFENMLFILVSPIGNCSQANFGRTSGDGASDC